MMDNLFQEQSVARALCRREHSVNVAKVALTLWRPSNKQVRLELEYLQK